MFEIHAGIICIAEHSLNGKLVKLVATQLEYDYQPDNNGKPNDLNNSEKTSSGFDLQTYDERQKDILEQGQKLIEPNKIKENFTLKILRQKVQPTNFSLKRIWTTGYGSKFSDLGKKFSLTEM